MLSHPCRQGNSNYCTGMFRKSQVIPVFGWWKEEKVNFHFHYNKIKMVIFYNLHSYFHLIFLPVGKGGKS